jgi:hypothetical protein
MTLRSGNDNPEVKSGRVMRFGPLRETPENRLRTHETDWRTCFMCQTPVAPR